MVSQSPSSEYVRLPLVYGSKKGGGVSKNCCYCLVAKRCPTLATPWTVARQAPVHGILQARTLEWSDISFSRGYSQPWDWTQVSCIGRWVFFFYDWATLEAHLRTTEERQSYVAITSLILSCHFKSTTEKTDIYICDIIQAEDESLIGIWRLLEYLVSRVSSI